MPRLAERDQLQDENGQNDHEFGGSHVMKVVSGVAFRSAFRPVLYLFGGLMIVMLGLLCVAVRQNELILSHTRSAPERLGNELQQTTMPARANPAPQSVAPQSLSSQSLPACPLGNSTSPLLLLRGGDVYDPSHLGKMDILIGGGKILKIFRPDSAEVTAMAKLDSVRVMDVTGFAVTPGLVDIHVHVTGGGGEKGPGSRTPAAKLSEMLQGGLSTVVGVLGTDSISLSVEALASTVAGLNRLPITAYMYTGAYRSVPESPTITGSVMKDIAVLESVVGVGEVAIADFRGSHLTVQQLATLASDAQVGGLLGGKAGVVYAHMGSNDELLSDLVEAVRKSGVGIQQVIPTHVSRTPELTAAAGEWLRAGGYADITAGSKAADVAAAYLQEALPADHILVSSDAYGSMPRFDAQKRLIGFDYARPSRLISFLNSMLAKGYDLATALHLVTRNPATALKLPRGKGQLIEEGDADVAVWALRGASEKTDQSLLSLQYLFNKGMLARAPDCVAKDMFEDAPP